MNLDEQALEARFREAFDIASPQVLTLDKPTTRVNKKLPWVRFSVSLGERARATTGLAATHVQLGGIYLQVFVPKDLGASGGDDLIEKFDDLFRDWQSEDGAIEVGRFNRTRTEEPDLWSYTLRFAFQSKRIK